MFPPVLIPAKSLFQAEVGPLCHFLSRTDPFGPDLQELQKADEQLVKINAFQKQGKWPLNTTKAEQRQLLPITNSLFLDSKAVWIRLTDAREGGGRRPGAGRPSAYGVRDTGRDTGYGYVIRLNVRSRVRMYYLSGNPNFRVTVDPRIRIRVSGKPKTE